MNKVIKLIDLFAGIGGIRKGFELACDEFGFKTECVFTSEIKPYHFDTDFLIFGYAMDEQTCDVVIKDLWLKKIWEITKTMDNWPITVQ